MTDFVDFYQKVAGMLPDDAIIAECGVANGRSAIMLAEMLVDKGKNFTLYMIDNMDYGHERQLNDIVGYVVNSGVGKYIKILKMSSLDASTEFPDDHFHFVFIDTSHKVQETKASVRAWYYKIKEGWMLAGHDYTSKENPEVGLAVNEVVPRVITRAEIPNQQTFEPERVLYNEPTTNGHGVWFLRKKFYVKLN